MPADRPSPTEQRLKTRPERARGEAGPTRAAITGRPGTKLPSGTRVLPRRSGPIPGSLVAVLNVPGLEENLAPKDRAS